MLGLRVTTDKRVLVEGMCQVSQRRGTYRVQPRHEPDLIVDRRTCLLRCGSVPWFDQMRGTPADCGSEGDRRVQQHLARAPAISDGSQRRDVAGERYRDDDEAICPRDGLTIQASDESVTVDEFAGLRRRAGGPIGIARA